MNTVSLVGIAASVFTAVSLAPQLLKVLKEKKAENVSMWMLAVLFCGLALWIYYGSLKGDLIIIISNAVSMVFNVILTVFSLKYKKSNS
jgi:MtN3 and saliva related transmembrane protein